MRTHFITAAWGGLGDENSRLRKVLAHPSLTHEDGEIDFKSLMVLGLMLCHASDKERAQFLFGLLQDGGIHNHSRISAGDKDMEPIFRQMCGFSTCEMYDMAETYGNWTNPYKDKVEQLKGCVKELYDSDKDESFNSVVFGYNSALDYEEWTDKASEDEAAAFLQIKGLRKKTHKWSAVAMIKA